MNKNKAVLLAEACFAVAEDLEEGRITKLAIGSIEDDTGCRCVLGHILAKVGSKENGWDRGLDKFLEMPKGESFGSGRTQPVWEENDSVPKAARRMGFTASKKHLQHVATVSREFGELVLRCAFDPQGAPNAFRI